MVVEGGETARDYSGRACTFGADEAFCASAIRGRRKYVVVWNASVTEANRKLSGLDCETRTLVEMFSMADGGKLPDVEL